MHAHYLQHVVFEGTRLFEPAEFPDLADFDLLVVMGGPMSVDDDKI